MLSFILFAFPFAHSYFLSMNWVAKFINESVQFACACVTHCFLWEGQLKTHTCIQTKATSIQFYTNIMRLNKSLSVKAESKPMYTLLIFRWLDTADLLLANGNTVTRYLHSDVLFKKRHTCSPQRERYVHTYTNTHRDFWGDLAGGHSANKIY